MPTPTLLYLINGPTRKPISQLDDRFAAFGLSVERYWAYNNEFPTDLTRYQGIVLAGSPHGAYEDIPWIQREHQLIQEAAALGIPMLGICFGSQILASALCGRDQVFRRSTCDIGYVPMQVATVAHADPVVGGMPDASPMFVWHNDEVRAGHPDMVILASSADCPNQVWRWRDQPIWGVQGHLEISLVHAPAWFADCREVMISDGADVDALLANAVEQTAAQTILQRFADYIAHPTPINQ